MNQENINKINSFLSYHKWCDFEIVELKGNLIIGGKTSFENSFDIRIVFEDVFYIQCLYEWKTDTSKDSFLIPDIEEQRNININYSIEQGYQIFKILAEDIDYPLYVSSKSITVELL